MLILISSSIVASVAVYNAAKVVYIFRNEIVKISYFQ